ncbi:hypothetical protein [Nocardia sp. NPDC005978]|uniref:hypothetical protein n=1 Tax=unclassified Nocardia TaxID=2637762 RepID=UPI0033B2EC6E
MNERIDEVSEADYLEQHTPAYPADAERSAAADAPDPIQESDSDIAAVPAGDSGWTADEGDLIEQSIPVPLDEDYQDSEPEY